MQALSTLPDIRPRAPRAPVCLSRGIFVFATGGTLYYYLEILFRGHSHFTMFLCGGVCFGGLYLINRLCHRAPRPLRWLLGAGLITLTEFGCGVIVNLLLGWEVWDYAGQPLNLLGQVCLPFSAIWFLLCIPADLLCDVLRRLFRTELPQKY